MPHTQTGALDMSGSVWLINGEPFDEVRTVLQAGATELWDLANPTKHQHPMHLHGGVFTILSRTALVHASPATNPATWARGAEQALQPTEAGLKDTVFVAAMEIVRVRVEVSGNLGRFLLHCHSLEHEDNAMMIQFRLARPPACNNNTVCDDDEDCVGCPYDCPALSAAVCGNQLCEVRMRVHVCECVCVRVCLHVCMCACVHVIDCMGFK
jgi:hypothetical protein